MSQLTLGQNPYSGGLLEGFSGNVPAELDQPITAEDASAGEWAAMKDSYRRDLLANVGLSAGLQLGQSGLQFINTAQDKRNKEQLAKLEGQMARGEYFDPGEQTLMEQTLLDPARAMGDEAQLRDEGLVAARGGTMSARDLARARRENRRAARKAAREAGKTIAAARLQRRREKLAELEARYAYKGERQRGKLESVSQALGAIGGVVGGARAAKKIKQFDPTGLIAAGYSSEEIDALTSALGGSRNALETWQLAAGLGRREKV